MITITTKKLVMNGKKMYKVLDIKALTAPELPDEYLTGYPRVYKVPSTRCTGLRVTSRDKVSHIWVGDVYTEQQWKELASIIEQSGWRLNAIRKRQLAGWQGEEIFRW